MVGGGETAASQESGDRVELYQGIECDMCRKAGKKEWGLVFARAVRNVSCEFGHKLRGIQRRQPIRCAEKSCTWEYGYGRKPTKDLSTKPSYFIVGDEQQFQFLPI